jgi:hypothetical protein
LTTRLRVATVVRAPRSRVWRQLRDVGSHVEWMADADAIRFVTERREGVGTTFDCDTRIGPLRLVDRMTVTEWRPRRAMGVRHVGLVTGEGRFALRRRPRRRTRLVWDERLRFPWWLGGPMGEVVARPVLRRVWRGNLRRFKRLVEQR